MGDQLEQFIQENKSSFDINATTVSEQRWQSIQRQLPKQPGSGTSIIWKVAAVIFLVSTSILLMDRFTLSEEDGVVSSQYEEFLQVEAFYTGMIEAKRTEIASYELEELSDDFLAEVARLDTLYDELKLTFDQRAKDQVVLDAMIQNLQLRIEILNQQLKILETLNTVKNEKIQNV